MITWERHSKQHFKIDQKNLPQIEPWVKNGKTCNDKTITWKDGFNLLYFLLTVICHQQMGIPWAVPRLNNRKSLHNGWCCLVLNYKWSNHLVVNICLNHNKKQRQGISCCAICCIEQTNVVSIFFKKFLLPSCLVDKKQLLLWRDSTNFYFVFVFLECWIWHRIL